MKVKKSHIAITTLTLAGFLGTFLAGFIFAWFLASENVFKTYGCYDLANFYSDIVTTRYNIRWNTDSTNPRRDINQRASDMLMVILNTCRTNPETNQIEGY